MVAASMVTGAKPTEDMTKDALGAATATELAVRHAKVVEKGLDWFPLFMITGVHLTALAGLVLYPVPSLRVFVSFLTMYLFSGLGITAGYHRMWSHKCYTGSLPWRVLWAIGGGTALQGSIKWWSRLHRLHHRFPDEECDPYGPQKGFWFSHCGWIYRPRHIPQLKLIDISDLDRDPVVQWQHRLYPYLALPVAYVLPLLISWEDPVQTLLWGGAMARCFVWHSTWCVNSLAHWLGENNFSDDQTAKDHVFTALVTLGEGYHDFHHSFPTDYRNGIKWYHYDPTKWLIRAAAVLGLARDLHKTPANMILKARFLMKDKAHELERSSIRWPSQPSSLPVMTVAEYRKEARAGGRRLLALDGFVLDVTGFMADHPGGDKLLRAYAGKEPETIANAFAANHKHTSAAVHLAHMMRVARLVQEGAQARGSVM